LRLIIPVLELQSTHIALTVYKKRYLTPINQSFPAEFQAPCVTNMSTIVQMYHDKMKDKWGNDKDSDPNQATRNDSMDAQNTFYSSPQPTNGDVKTELKSKWPVALDLYGSNLPCRLEGEVADLVVYGTIPKEIDGTFYRVMVDPFVPPVEGNVPIDGDGNISAFRFHNGRVDMKTRYVETQRYKLERRAGKALFGLYRNPYTHHPCVRAAVDSTANTNLMLWAGRLLAMKESALPYAVNPETLETKSYDPFPTQNKTLSLTLLSATATKQKIKNEFWSKMPFEPNRPGLIHDCAITKSWLLLFVWPFDASVERMKRGGHHWAYNYSRGHTIIVIPRDAENPPCGWKKGETRHYIWKNCMAIHTAGAWEDESDPSKIFVESSRVHDNAFPFFPPEDGRMPSKNTKADFVRWEVNANEPDGGRLVDPRILLDCPNEFPRIDERLMGREYHVVWMNVFIKENSSGGYNDFSGLNGLAQVDHRNGETKWYYAGDDSLIQEPVFVPRSEDAVEGDGWVIALVDRVNVGRCDVVVIDTREFEKEVAIVQLPFHMKAQVHGNWVSAKDLGGYKPLVREIAEFEMLKRGALEPL
ncbi:Lignostilbene-alpha,beta-dioxygenase isozyme I, partial [Pseudocercospora fuligena]